MLRRAGFGVAFAGSEYIYQVGGVMPHLQVATGVKGMQPQTEAEIRDRNILCIDCQLDFVWTIGEQVFFRDKGLLNPPKRCKPCKQAKNERIAAIIAAQNAGVRQRIEVLVNCAQCGQETTVPFYPSQGRPVYCRGCYAAQHGGAAPPAIHE